MYIYRNPLSIRTYLHVIDIVCIARYLSCRALKIASQSIWRELYIWVSWSSCQKPIVANQPRPKRDTRRPNKHTFRQVAPFPLPAQTYIHCVNLYFQVFSQKNIYIYIYLKLKNKRENITQHTHHINTSLFLPYSIRSILLPFFFASQSQQEPEKHWSVAFLMVAGEFLAVVFTSWCFRSLLILLMGHLRKTRSAHLIWGLATAPKPNVSSI